MGETYTLSELAGLAGVPASRVKFYKQHGLLPPVYGLGRGANYGVEHVEQLCKIAEYRGLGYSLAAIRAIFEEKVDSLPTEESLAAAGVTKGVNETKAHVGDARHPSLPNPNLTQTNVAKVFGRVKLFEGLEVHYEIGRYVVYPSNVEELREAMRAILCAGIEET